MAVPPINRAEVKAIAKQIANAKNKKEKVAELLGEPGSEKRGQLDPNFIKAVKRQTRKIIQIKSGQPILHPIKNWKFAQIVRDIQSRIEKPSEASIEEAHSALERGLGEVNPNDYIDVCNIAASLLQMYEHGLPREARGERDEASFIASTGTRKYFYDELRRRHDSISYLELDVDAIATKSSLAVLRLTENEEVVAYSLSLSDMELNNTINVLSKLTYPQKRDLILAYFMNPGTSGGELYPLMRSLFAIANNLDKEIKVEQVNDTQILEPINDATTEENYIGHDDLPLNTVRYVEDGELIEDLIDFGDKEETTEAVPTETQDFASKQEEMFKDLAKDVNNINQFLGELLYTQAMSFPDELDSLNTLDFNLDEAEEGGISLIDQGQRSDFALNQYTKQYVIHRQEILIQGLEEHIFDFSLDKKIELFKKVNGDEHRLRLACILSNEAESESDISKVENLFLNEVNDSSLEDSTGYRASKGVEYYANFKKAEAVEKLIEFLDHEDHMVRYEAFKKLCDEEVTENPGTNNLVDKIEADFRSGNPSWTFAALCKQSSSKFSTDLGNEDKYRAPFLRVLMLKNIDIKDAMRKMEGLEVPFTLNTGEPSPGETEPITTFEVINYIGIPELVEISIHSPSKTVRNNAMGIIEVLLEERPNALDEFMKTSELADSLRKAVGISHSTGDTETQIKREKI